MSYRAKVVKVMIASPGDVVAERNAIRNVIQEWNFAHSEDKNIVLMPIGWESHSSPAMGARPQAIINKQVLKDCDLLIAVFWTRLGTPTGKAASGTLEEIDEHVKAKKPAMVYFSAIPPAYGNVDPEQYRALQEFKAQLRERGLYAEYGSLEEFREMLTRQLAQTVNRHFTSKKNGPVESDDVPIFRPKLPVLSDRAKFILIEASQDPDGTILRLPARVGYYIHTNGMDFGEGEDSRSAAQWVAAFDELWDKQLIQDRGSRNGVFGLSDEGYRIADLLKEKQLVLH